MAPLERDIQFKMLLTPEEKAQLVALAEAEGLTASDYIRQHIRRSYALAHAAPKTSAEAMLQRKLRADTAAAASMGEQLARRAAPKKTTKSTTKKK